ncbi:epoxide hydrolase family protein [Cryobacterium sp. W22_MBD10_FK3]|uniref:epoxide hydrolase family protein n=1 Tax=Cryobacterium sp. W22_MBD10_FK3 TaxID=3240273 RepID=UPI003F8F283C
MQQFLVKIPDAEVADLHHRLSRTRVVPKSAYDDDWEAGVPSSFVTKLVKYWGGDFDWRAQEAWLNTFPQFTAQVAGQRVHFVHVKSALPRATPIIISHGWPYGFSDMLPLVPLLREFDLVIPSLPGFGFSDRPAGPFTDHTVASTLHTLMTEVLGYAKYGTYGEDIGSAISHRLAGNYPEAVVGIFATHPAIPTEGRFARPTDAEKAFINWLDKAWHGETGYQALQSTRPSTLAAALIDSPAGLAAWIVEKFSAWSDRGSEPGAQSLEEKFSLDDLLTTVSLYWFTQSIGSSFLSYHDFHHRTEAPLVRVPAGIAIGQGDLGYPQSLAERCYTDLRSFEILPRGGHFMAKEEPALVAKGISNFFSALTSPQAG